MNSSNKQNHGLHYVFTIVQDSNTQNMNLESNQGVQEKSNLDQTLHFPNTPVTP